MRSRKHFWGTLCLWIDVLRVQSRKNNSENLTIFRGEFKTENFKKIRKNQVSEFFFSDFPQKHPSPSIRPKKKVFDAS